MTAQSSWAKLREKSGYYSLSCILRMSVSTGHVRMTEKGNSADSKQREKKQPACWCVTKICISSMKESAVFMWRQPKQIHRKDNAAQQDCCLFSGITLFIPGGDVMENTKTGISQVLWTKGKCVWLTRTHTVVNWPYLGLYFARLHLSCHGCIIKI